MKTSRMFQLLTLTIFTIVVGILAIGCGGAHSSPSVARAGMQTKAPERILGHADTRYYGGVDVIVNADGARFLRTVATHSVVTPRNDNEEDPFATLVTRFVEKPHRVLVVGIGSGRLVTQLVDKFGVEVDVIERDPHLVALVSKHLGIRGHVVIDEDPWSLVEGKRTSSELPLLGGRATTTGSDDVYDALLAEEDVDQVDRWRTHIARHSGVPLRPSALIAGRLAGMKPFFDDGELEGPTVFASARAGGGYDVVQVIAEFVPPFKANGLTLWPSSRNITHAENQVGPTKDVRAFGYVSRLPSGEIVLEVPYDGETTITLRLGGPMAQAKFGSRQDLTPLRLSTKWPDPKVSYEQTLAPLIGGPHPNYRSREMLVSPVAAAVRGRARLVGHGDLFTDKHRNGFLFELEVTSVDTVFDRASWAPVEQRHTANLEAAAAAIAKDDLLAAADALRASLTELHAYLGDLDWRCAWFESTTTFEQTLRSLAEKHASPVTACEGLVNLSGDSNVWPHRAQRVLERTIKQTTERTMMRIAKSSNRNNKESYTEGERAASCWWDWTVHDPNFPDARHLEISKKFPHVTRGASSDRGRW